MKPSSAAHLRACLQERLLLLHPGNQLLGQTHDAVARALQAAGRPEAAAAHLRASLRLLQRQYPPNSTAVAFQQLKLAAMLRVAGDAVRVGPAGGESRELEAAARQVLQLHFGPAVADALVADVPA